MTLRLHLIEGEHEIIRLLPMSKLDGISDYRDRGLYLFLIVCEMEAHINRRTKKGRAKK